MRLALPPIVTAFLSRTTDFGPLPHEWAFGGWLAAMAVWLAMAAGVTATMTLIFSAYALASIALIAWCQRRPTPLRWRLRLLWYPSVMGLAYYSLPAAVAALGRHSVDARLANWDVALLGAPVAERLQALSSPAVTDLLMLAYLFFFVVLIFGPGHYCLRDLARFRACIVGLFIVYALGFASYVLMPAAGPIHHLVFSAALPLGPFAQRMQPLINGASNGVDVFPSIHVAASLYLLVFDYQHYRRRFWWWLLPIAALWLSTVYLRYHYLVDLFAGVVIAVIGLSTATAYARSKPAQRTDAWALSLIVAETNSSEHQAQVR